MRATPKDAKATYPDARGDSQAVFYWRGIMSDIDKFEMKPQTKEETDVEYALGMANGARGPQGLDDETDYLAILGKEVRRLRLCIYKQERGKIVDQETKALDAVKIYRRTLRESVEAADAATNELEAFDSYVNQMGKKNKIIAEEVVKGGNAADSVEWLLTTSEKYQARAHAAENFIATLLPFHRRIFAYKRIINFLQEIDL
jgi:hypothetical protein